VSGSGSLPDFCFQGRDDSWRRTTAPCTAAEIFELIRISIRSLLARQSSELPVLLSGWSALTAHPDLFRAPDIVSPVSDTSTQNLHPAPARSLFFYLILFFLSLMEKSVKCQVSNCRAKCAGFIFVASSGILLTFAQG
jgi:hypothetical protein